MKKTGSFLLLLTFSECQGTRVISVKRASPWPMPYCYVNPILRGYVGSAWCIGPVKKGEFHPIHMTEHHGTETICSKRGQGKKMYYIWFKMVYCSAELTCTVLHIQYSISIQYSELILDTR